MYRQGRWYQVVNSSIECCRNDVFLKANSQDSITLAPFVVRFLITGRLKMNNTVVALSYSLHTLPGNDPFTSCKVEVEVLCD